MPQIARPRYVHSGSIWAQIRAYISRVNADSSLLPNPLQTYLLDASLYVSRELATGTSNNGNIHYAAQAVADKDDGSLFFVAELAWAFLPEVLKEGPGVLFDAGTRGCASDGAVVLVAQNADIGHVAWQQVARPYGAVFGGPRLDPVPVVVVLHRVEAMDQNDAAMRYRVNKGCSVCCEGLMGELTQHLEALSRDFRGWGRGFPVPLMLACSMGVASSASTTSSFFQERRHYRAGRALFCLLRGSDGRAHSTSGSFAPGFSETG